MQRVSEEPATLYARVTPGLAAGSRPRGLDGWAGHLRRHVFARLRGEPNPPQLVRHRLRLGRDVLIAGGCHLDAEFAWLISIGDVGGGRHITDADRRRTRDEPGGGPGYTG